MTFDLYRRDDLHLVVVPALLPRPARLATEGALQGIGTASLPFNDMSHALGQDIAIHGYGVAGQADEALICRSMVPRH